MLVWLATGATDMRRGMNGLALQVQQALLRDPHAGDVYVFRGKRGNLLKILWHDGLGMSLYAKRLERGRFIWPSPADGVIVITPRSGAICLTALIGGIRNEPGDRRWLVDSVTGPLAANSSCMTSAACVSIALAMGHSRHDAGRH